MKSLAEMEPVKQVREAYNHRWTGFMSVKDKLVAKNKKWKDRLRREISGKHLILFFKYIFLLKSKKTPDCNMVQVIISVYVV